MPLENYGAIQRAAAWAPASVPNAFQQGRQDAQQNALFNYEFQQQQNEDAQHEEWLSAIKEGQTTGDYAKAFQLDPVSTTAFAKAQLEFKNMQQQATQAERMSGLGEVGIYRKPLPVPNDTKPIIESQGGYSWMRDPTTGNVMPSSVQTPQRAPIEAPAKPQLVDVPQPDGTTQKQWVYPGQSRGAPVGAPTTSAAAKPPTESDKKVATLFGSMVTAANNLADLSGADTSSLGNAALDSNPLTRAATSGDYRKYQSAAKQWSANLLYIKSGATATPEEVYSTYQQFFPQPGDTEEVKAQKAAAREQEMRNIQATYPDTTKQYNWKPPRTNQAPAQAVEYLRAHPETKAAFKAKYGYIPDGI